MAGKHRSPNYPAVGLGEAIRLARSLWDREKKTTVAPDVAVKAFGYNSLSGPARVKIATLKKYQLLEEDSNGIRISPLALELFQHDEDTEPYLRAAREAALAPELFRALAQTFIDGSDDALRKELTFKRGFSDDGAAIAIKAFRDTVAAAKLEQGVISGSTDTAVSPLQSVSAGADKGSATAAIAAATSPSLRTFSWPLSKGVTAEVRFTGEHLGAEHLQRLRKYLELAEDALRDDSSGSAESD